MEFRAEMNYPATPNTVFGLLTNLEFLEELCQKTGALSHQVRIEPATDGLLITTDRTLSSAELPDFVRKFAGSELTVRRRDLWATSISDQRTGQITVEILGTPVKLSGKLNLSGTQTTSETLIGDLKAAIPLLGRKVEMAAQTPIRAAISVEENLMRSWLDRLAKE